MGRVARFALLIPFLFGVLPIQGQDTGVVITSMTAPVEMLRLSDFDPISPETAPIFITIWVANDDVQRDLSLDILIQAESFGYLGRMGMRLGPLSPHEERRVTNRDFDSFDFGDADELFQVATELGRFPSDVYTFDIRVLDHSVRPRGEPVAEDESTLETSNAGFQLDLLTPGAPFGQEPDVLANPFPVFEWLASAQAFDFALYKVRPSQGSPEDVVNSRPVYLAENIVGSTFLYPSAAEELEPGATYAWQVRARIMTAAGTDFIPSVVYAFTMSETLGGGAQDASLAPPDLSEDAVSGSPLTGRIATRLEVEPQEVDLPPGSPFLFRVAAYDADDEPVQAFRPQWQVTPSSAGTIDENGLFVSGDEPGPAAIYVRAGTLEDFATVFIQPGADPAPLVADQGATADSAGAAADSSAAVAAADTLDIRVRLVAPFEDQAIREPLPAFAWEVSGADSMATQRYRVQMWEAPADLPAAAIPDAAPLMNAPVQNTQTAAYPAGAPPPQGGLAYVARVDVLGAGGQVLAQSAPVRFTIASDDKIGWDLRQAWSQAQRQQQDGVAVTILAQLVAPALTSLDRQALLGAGIQIDLEDGPWLQLSVPFSQLSQLSQFGFIRVLNLPAPPLLSALPDALADAGVYLTPPQPHPLLNDAFSSSGAPVSVAVFEFGFDTASLKTMRGGKPFYEHSFRRDGNIQGSNSLMAVHGVASVRALLDYLPDNAELHLFNFETELEFREALHYAVNTLGVRVISCSVSWMEAYDNYDGTSYFSQQLSHILADEAVLVAAAGNFGRSHWEGQFTDSAGDGFHDFETASQTLQLQLRKDIDYKFLLSWSDDWEDPQVDFDLQILNAAGTPLYDPSGAPYRSANRQGPQEPQERIRSFRSYLPGTQTYQLRIEARRLKRDAEAMPHLELYMYPPPEAATPQAQSSSSLAGGLATSRSEAVLAVSAASFEHSSQGPTNDNRVRPDFAAGGTVQLQGAQMEGTSFATPRVAAAFALVLSKYPGWSIEQATEYLRTFCPADTDLDKDNRYGWGEIDFDALIKALTS